MKLEESIVIHASPISLFRLTKDYEHRLEWDPFLRSATLVDDAQEAGVGVKALCVARSRWVMGDRVCLVEPPTSHGRENDPRPLVSGQFRRFLEIEETEPGPATLYASVITLSRGRGGCHGYWPPF